MDTDPPSRAALVAMRDQVAGGPPSPALAAYLDKVRRRAHAITDDDVATLLASGVSEDEVYRATMNEAMTAGIDRFDIGLRALRGAR
jgi:alkylhydroperoxidase family enzyme